MFSSITQPTPGTAIFVSDVRRSFLEYSQQFTDQTQIQYKKCIDNFFKSIFPQVQTIQQLTPQIIRQYMILLQTKRIKSRTVNSYMIAIRSFCRFAAEMYDIPNPTIGIKNLKTDPPASRFLTDIEYKKISSCRNSHKNKLLFLANTGLRAAEFEKIRQADIQPDLRSIVVLGKGRKRRSVPLNSICREILTADPAINYLDGSPIKYNTLYYICKRIAKSVKVATFGPHALRHYFATKLLLAGVNIAIVSKILGHSSIQITEQTYIHIMPENMIDVTECIV